MTYPLDRRSFLMQTAAGAAAGVIGSGRARAQVARSERALLIDAERAVIRAGMTEGGIGAAAVCLVHEGGPAWVEGFGRTNDAGGRPVTPDTIFSIQSTSKNFTAVAVLLAVQEGVLDLDLPITRYLPDFSVNSRFERSPQERMTLRLLLSHRAGFTHEAPVGNNYEPASPGFEAHVRSIQETWLRFPVGDRYRYSNLGYDLAGYILERKTGVSYAEWLRRKLFVPLGMASSTADPAVYSNVANRASGTHRGYTEVPLITPLVASGGVWTNARDMAAYLAFLVAGGRGPGGQILAPELWREMHGFGLGGDYGLGTIREERRYGSTALRMLSHRGGGFGFGCEFTYCPEAGLGWAALFNRPALAGYRFGNELVDRMLAARFGERALRLPTASLAPIRPLPAQVRALVGSYVGRNVRGEISESGGQLRFLKQGTEAPQALNMTSPDDLFITSAEGEATTYRYYPATAALPAHLECSRGEDSLDYNDGPNDPDGPGKREWGRHVGRYRVEQWGRPSIDVTIELRRRWLYLNDVRLIVETQPGLFFASDGEAVDFRSPEPTWKSLLLRRS